MKALMSVIFITLLVMTGSDAMAKNKIKRIDFEEAKKESVAMAVETYDGEFFDLSDFKDVKKFRGNIEKMKKVGRIELKDGEEVEVNAIRYFFVQAPKKRGFVRPETFKTPFDEE